MNGKIINSNHIQVTLSKRNLETLLSKVEREGSKRTLVRWLTGNLLLTVTAEPDEEHYQGREPGPVHLLDDPGPFPQVEFRGEPFVFDEHPD